jgi:hypothetical protein
VGISLKQAWWPPPPKPHQNLWWGTAFVTHPRKVDCFKLAWCVLYLYIDLWHVAKHGIYSRERENHLIVEGSLFRRDTKIFLSPQLFAMCHVHVR